MYTKLIKFVLLLSLVLLSGFAGRVLHSPLLNRASRGRDPRHTKTLIGPGKLPGRLRNGSLVWDDCGLIFPNSGW